MHRNSLLGRSLQNAIDVLSIEKGYQITPKQLECIWQTFDESIEETLREIPKDSLLYVSSSRTEGVASVESDVILPTATSSSAMETSGNPRDEEVPNTSITQEKPSLALSTDAAIGSSGEAKSNKEALHEKNSTKDVDNDAAMYPMYRCLNGVWTIILKDAVVRVKTEQNREQFMELDYLKIEAHEVPTSEGGVGENPLGRV